MKAARALRTQALSTQVQTADQSDSLKKVRVFVRVRPCLEHEKARGARHSDLTYSVADKKVTAGRSSAVTASAFEFDGVLGDTIAQEEVYHNLDVSSMIASVLAGYNATVFAYGQTGSGKTHTIEGPHAGGTEGEPQEGLHLHAGSGVAPRTIFEMFRQISALKESDTNDDFSVECSYLEIYNEEVFDLLAVTEGSNSRSRAQESLKIRWSRQLGFHVPRLTRAMCAEPADALKLFYTGVRRKTMGSHRLNATSSRSHAIFSIYVCRTKAGAKRGGRVEDTGGQLDDENDSDGAVDMFEHKLGELGFETKSQLNLVDLAGSERIKMTGTTGRAKVESIQINKSLFVLRKVGFSTLPLMVGFRVETNSLCL